MQGHIADAAISFRITASSKNDRRLTLDFPLSSRDSVMDALASIISPATRSPDRNVALRTQDTTLPQSSAPAS